jgi:hypothetical protein
VTSSGRDRRRAGLGDLEDERLVHDAEDVAERVDHRRGDESAVAVLGERLVLRGAEREQARDRAGQVVDGQCTTAAAGPVSSCDPDGAKWRFWCSTSACGAAAKQRAFVERRRGKRVAERDEPSEARG